MMKLYHFTQVSLQTTNMKGSKSQKERVKFHPVLTKSKLYRYFGKLSFNLKLKI